VERGHAAIVSDSEVDLAIDPQQEQDIVAAWWRRVFIIDDQ
jgi:hypothetical protein